MAFAPQRSRLHKCERGKEIVSFLLPTTPRAHTITTAMVALWQQQRKNSKLGLFVRKRQPLMVKRQQLAAFVVGVVTILLTVMQVILLARSSLIHREVEVDRDSHHEDDEFTKELESQVVLPDTSAANHLERYAYPGDKMLVSHECKLNTNRNSKICSRHNKDRCFSHVPEVMPAPRDTPDDEATCKTLWFSGFDEGPLSQCEDKGGRGIRIEYAAALASARQHANGVLQPVLLMSRFGVSGTNTSSTVSEWAHQQGAIVVTVDRLSFQEEIVRWSGGEASTTITGPYLRMDIPQIIKKHGLFDLPDADILFVSPISHLDMESLKSYLVHRSTQRRWWRTKVKAPSWKKQEPPLVLYGREWHMKSQKPLNTGVMLIDVPAFRKELPSLIDFRNKHIDPSKFYAFDQGWLNLYFGQNKTMEAKRHLLPLYWNWKLYWKLEPSVYSLLKIVHFHGPKPSIGAREMATCNLDHVEEIPLDYRGLIEDATCCDEGKTANRVLRFYDRIRPPPEVVC